MINEFNAAKSCLTVLKAYTDANDYGLSIDGTTASFAADSIYLEERLFSEDNSQGINNNSSQFQLPIYQISIRTPKVMGKWKGLAIYGELVGLFKRQTDISLDSDQKVRIEQVNKTELPASDTHNLTVVSVNLRLVG